MFIIDKDGNCLECPVIFDIEMIPFDLVSALSMIGVVDRGSATIFDMSLDDFLGIKLEVKSNANN